MLLSLLGGSGGGQGGGGILGGVSQITSGLVSGITGLIQRGEAKKILKDNPYPTYEIPNEVREAAATGLPSEQYNQAMQNIQRQQLTALKNANDRRGGLATVGTINQQTNDATLSLDAKNAMARQQNQLRLASYRDKAFDWNVKNKYQQNYGYGMSLLGAGNQNLTGGIDKALAGAGYLSLGGSGGARGGASPY